MGVRSEEMDWIDAKAGEDVDGVEEDGGRGGGEEVGVTLG